MIAPLLFPNGMCREEEGIGVEVSNTQASANSGCSLTANAFANA